MDLDTAVNLFKTGYDTYTFFRNWRNRGALMLRGSYGKTKRKRGSLGRLRGVKRRLFSAKPSGENYVAPRTVKRGKKKKLSLIDKVSRFQYPPFTVINNAVTGLDVDSPNQGVVSYLMFGDAAENISAFNQVRDVYHNSNVMENNMPLTNPTSPMQGNYRIYAQSLSHTQTILNSSTATANITVLVVTPARLMSGTTATFEDPVSWWTQCNVDAKATAQADVNTSLNVDYSNAMPITQLYDRPYKRATQYNFARFWKIVDKTSRVLQPGQMFKHTFVKGNQRVLNYNDMQLYKQFPGLTHYCIIICNGQIVNGSLTTGFTDVSVSSTQLSIMRQMKRTYSYQTAARPIVMRYGNLTAVATANQKFINDDELAVDNYAEL